MATQTIIWTALPERRQRRTAACCCRCTSRRGSCRTVPHGQLSGLRRFETWPNTALDATGGAVRQRADHPGQRGDEPGRERGAVGATLFAPTTLVRGRAFEDFTQRTRAVVSGGQRHLAPARQLRGRRDRGRQRLPDGARAPPVHRSVARGPVDAALGQVEIQNGAPNYAIRPARANPSLDFAQLKKFHTPPATIAPGSPGPKSRDIDFHEMCSLAQDHPDAAAPARLVVDLELLDPPSVSGITTARVLVDWSPSISGTTNVSPLTSARSASRSSAPCRARAISTSPTATSGSTTPTCSAWRRSTRTAARSRR